MRDIFELRMAMLSPEAERVLRYLVEVEELAEAVLSDKRQVRDAAAASSVRKRTGSRSKRLLCAGQWPSFHPAPTAPPDLYPPHAASPTPISKRNPDSHPELGCLDPSGIWLGSRVTSRGCGWGSVGGPHRPERGAWLWF